MSLTASTSSLTRLVRSLSTVGISLSLLQNKSSVFSLDSLLNDSGNSAICKKKLINFLPLAPLLGMDPTVFKVLGRSVQANTVDPDNTADRGGLVVVNTVNLLINLAA